MKHGTKVQTKRKRFKLVETSEWGIDWDPWTGEHFYGFIRKTRWEPDGWHYHGPSFRYRFDPVPGVKHWKNSIRPYVRHMRTTQERRWSYAHEGYVRKKRNYIHLPNTWDDCWYARREKGWKRTHKKRQWMKKGDKLVHKLLDSESV